MKFDEARFTDAVSRLRELSGIDVRPQADMGRIARRTSTNLRDVNFICEAFSELDEDAILFVGRSADFFEFPEFDAYTCELVGRTVMAGLRNYALRCAVQTN